MTTGFKAHRMTRRKKLEYECVGCGFCCLEVLCDTAIEKHGYIEPCPELFWNGTRYLCKLLPENKKHQKVIEFGTGCACPNTCRLDIRPRTREDLMQEITLELLPDGVRLEEAHLYW
jgi:hypothetical protein